MFLIASPRISAPLSGPHIAWRAGRVDKPNGSVSPPDGNLPDATKGAPHIREIFGRMGFGDQELVALSGESHTFTQHNTVLLCKQLLFKL